ncbi:MAG: ABC transporter permease subunit [Lachnospiraceae bacterium]|nr:ABC transporter permease subunit [Lachnospiraceae bacterium]
MEKGKKLLKSIWKNKTIYIVLLPALVWYLVFVYVPMGGLMLAFKDYKANLGILGSPWIGLEHFQNLFNDIEFWQSVGRTLKINILRLFITFPMPVIIALLFNELRMNKYKKVLQTVFTFPHFLSWIIIAGVLKNILAYDGIVNGIIGLCGGETVNFLGNKSLFQPMLYITDIWKEAGWGSIIYLAAISGIDQEQYEAADIDGATRWQKMMHITLPNIMPTVAVMFILAAGGIMNAGFDQIFNMTNAAVREAGEILDMYIYRITFQATPDFGFSMAVSLFRSVINMLLLVIADRGSRFFGGNGLFG